MERWEEYLDREYRDGEYRRFELAEEKTVSPQAWVLSWAPLGMLGLGVILLAWVK